MEFVIKHDKTNICTTSAWQQDTYVLGWHWPVKTSHWSEWSWTTQDGGTTYVLGGQWPASDNIDCSIWSKSGPFGQGKQSGSFGQGWQKVLMGGVRELKWSIWTSTRLTSYLCPSRLTLTSENIPLVQVELNNTRWRNNVCPRWTMTSQWQHWLLNLKWKWSIWTRKTKWSIWTSGVKGDKTKIFTTHAKWKTQTTSNSCPGL
jgi:hypothetical protein